MEKGSDFSPPSINSLNYDASAFPQHIIVITGKSPVELAAHMSHVFTYCSGLQSQQNVGTEAFISEHP